MTATTTLARARRDAIERLREWNASVERTYELWLAAGERPARDLGYVHHSTRTRSRVELALMDIENGLANGYPPCCVEEYALDSLAGRVSGARRGGVPNGADSVYVPCSECCRAMGREFIP